MYYIDKVDIIDLNLGCPQNIAKRGLYGAYLLEQEEIALKVVEKCVNMPKPFSVKIRVFEDEERTINFAK